MLRSPFSGVVSGDGCTEGELSSGIDAVYGFESDSREYGKVVGRLVVEQLPSRCRA